MVVWFPVNQNEIGPDVAIAVIAPLARERVIEVASRQQRMRSKYGNEARRIALAHWNKDAIINALETKLQTLVTHGVPQVPGP
jgi:hypothetical protein